MRALEVKTASLYYNRWAASARLGVWSLEWPVEAGNDDNFGKRYVEHVINCALYTHKVYNLRTKSARDPTSEAAMV